MRTKLHQLGSFICAFDDIRSVHTRLPTFVIQAALSPFLCEQGSAHLCGISFSSSFPVAAASTRFFFFHLEFFCFSVVVASIVLLFFSACPDQSDKYSSVLPGSRLTLLNQPPKQGRTAQSYRTCWLTSETRRTCLTCSLPPRLLRPGPARSGSASTKGIELTKVLIYTSCLSESPRPSRALN